MKTWRYNEPQPDPTKQQPYVNKVITVTDDEIIDMYWGWWKKQIKKVGRHHLLTRENCIQDFVTEHWAWEIK